MNCLQNSRIKTNCLQNGRSDFTFRLGTINFGKKCKTQASAIRLKLRQHHQITKMVHVFCFVGNCSSHALKISRSIDL